MICKAYRIAGDYNREGDAVWAAEWHSHWHCKGGNWCDCQHALGVWIQAEYRK